MVPRTTWPNTFTDIVMMSCGVGLQSTKFSTWPPGWIEGENSKGNDLSLMKYISHCSHAAFCIAHSVSVGGQFRGHTLVEGNS